MREPDIGAWGEDGDSVAELPSSGPSSGRSGRSSGRMRARGSVVQAPGNVSCGAGPRNRRRSTLFAFLAEEKDSSAEGGGGMLSVSSLGVSAGEPANTSKWKELRRMSMNRFRHLAGATPSRSNPASSSSAAPAPPLPAIADSAVDEAEDEDLVPLPPPPPRAAAKHDFAEVVREAVRRRPSIQEKIKRGNVRTSILATDVVPFHQQANLALYTDEAKNSREALRRHTRVCTSIKRWWLELGFQREPVGMRKAEYVALCVALARVLSPENFKEKVAREGAEREWAKDSNGQELIAYDAFQEAIFELADLWTLDISAESYVNFLNNTLEAIAPELRTSLPHRRMRRTPSPPRSPRRGFRGPTAFDVGERVLKSIEDFVSKSELLSRRNPLSNIHDPQYFGDDEMRALFGDSGPWRSRQKPAELSQLTLNLAPIGDGVPEKVRSFEPFFPRYEPLAGDAAELASSSGDEEGEDGADPWAERLRRWRLRRVYNFWELFQEAALRRESGSQTARAGGRGGGGGGGG